VAVRRVVAFVDDVDGSAAVETVWFGVDGVGYEVDLSAVNAAALRAVLGGYLAAARRVGRVEAGAAGRVRHALTRAQQASTAAAAAAGPPVAVATERATELPAELPAVAEPAAHRPGRQARSEPAGPRFSHPSVPPTPTR
jgi:hypothetical protein